MFHCHPVFPAWIGLHVTSAIKHSIWHSLLASKLQFYKILVLMSTGWQLQLMTGGTQVVLQERPLG